ncbi:MAG: inositol monophosphatase family protein [Desulfobacterales bacterium]
MSEEQHTVEELSQFARDVVRQAGDMAMKYYGKGRHQVKFDEGLVTEIELRLNEFFQGQLAAHYPEHQVLANRQISESYTHDSTRYLWIFDPLDGVANAQAGIPIWGISLALVENFWPVLGAFYMPVTRDLFFGRAGGRATQDDVEIRVSPQETLNDESLLLIYSRFHQNYRANFPGKIRNLGCTTAHLCYVAMGRAEGAVLFNESYHDLAAARVIVEAAGGRITKADGSEFHLNEYLDKGRIPEHLIVSSPSLADQIGETLEPTGG